jgi:hypothetical protein
LLFWKSYTYSRTSIDDQSMALVSKKPTVTVIVAMKAYTCSKNSISSQSMAL